MAGSLQGFNLRIDTKDTQRVLGEIRSKLDLNTFANVMHDTVSDMRRRAITPINRAIRAQYRVGVSEVIEAFGPLKGGSGSLNMRCWYDVAGKRKLVPKQGRDSKKKYYTTGKFKARIVVGGEEELPLDGRRPHIRRRGGQILVVHKDKKRTYIRTYTRKKDGKTVQYEAKMNLLTRAVSLAIPQMPLNRSREELVREVQDVMIKRLLHNTARRTEIFG